MIIKRRSTLTGILHEREIDITEEQLVRWAQGEVIQKVAPHLSAADREFIISGSTPEEWNDLFQELDEDY